METNLEITRKLIKELISPSVLFLQNYRQAGTLIKINNKWVQGLGFVPPGILRHVHQTHSEIYSGTGIFPSTAYDRIADWELEVFFDDEILPIWERWGNDVPRSILVHLVNLDYQGIRKRLNTEELREFELGAFLRQLDRQRLYGVFGSGAKITYGQYLRLTTLFQQWEQPTYKIRILGDTMGEPVHDLPY
jgi:hypothetical protein